MTGWCGYSKVETVFASLHFTEGQWRQRRRPLWIAFMAWLQATRVWTDRLIPTDATMRISINNGITFFFIFWKSYPHGEKIPFESIKNVHTKESREQRGKFAGSEKGKLNLLWSNSFSKIIENNHFAETSSYISLNSVPNEITHFGDRKLKSTR